MRAACALLCLLALVRSGVCSPEPEDIDLDNLEDILHNLDEIDKKTFSEEEGVDDTRPAVAHGHWARDQPESSDACWHKMCAWGQECRVDANGAAYCACMERCPIIEDADPFDKVCSNHNQTFPSLCDLYRQRCLCKRWQPGCQHPELAKAHLEYLGECKRLDHCSSNHMVQFPTRMSDWLFQVMKDMRQRRELTGRTWRQLFKQAEQDDHLRHVYPVIWKFCELDSKPHDKIVSRHELIPITAPVIPMESCIKPFLLNCDKDNDGSISLREWGNCLGLRPDEIVEHC